jgi:hypothetical protein
MSIQITIRVLTDEIESSAPLGLLLGKGLALARSELLVVLRVGTQLRGGGAALRHLHAVHRLVGVTELEPFLLILVEILISVAPAIPRL